MTEQTSKAPKKPRDRSPSYPFIPLKTAIERLEAFESYFGRHPAPFKKAGLAWKMKEDSSQANQTLATLKSFGLIEYKGSGSDRSVVLSEDGRTYLRAQQEGIKKEILKRVALRPKAIARFWPTWNADRPPDAVCLDDLVLKHKFNDKAAPVFLKVYDDTIAFAELSSSDKVGPVDEDESDDGDGSDFDGEDDNNRFRPPPPPPPFRVPKELEPMAGERELTTGLLAKDASFRLIVSGKIGVKEIERLIKKLELDKEILAESDDEDDDTENADA